MDNVLNFLVPLSSSEHKFVRCLQYIFYGCITENHYMKQLAVYECQGIF